MAHPLPDNFDEIIQKIAASSYPTLKTIPESLALLGKSGLDEFKTVLGPGGKDATGAQKLLGGVLGTALGSLLAATGNMTLDKYKETQVGNLNQHEWHNKELGQLKARTKFKEETLEKLRPIHTKIIKDLKKNDSVIRDADSKVIDSTYKTMTNFAPLLAADENAARSFLRTTIESGADHPGFNVLQAVSDAERSAQQAGGILTKVE